MPKQSKGRLKIKLEVGDRVIPIDRAWLWRSPDVKLIVTRCKLCEAPAYRGEPTIELMVCWRHGSCFKAWQFAKHYKKYDPSAHSTPHLSVVRREY